MAIFGYSVTVFVFRTFYIHGHTKAFRWYDCHIGHTSRSLDCFTSNFSKTVCDTAKVLLIGNDTLAFDWCHFWWPWSTLEGHFSLGCHFHVHFNNPWHAYCFRVARSPSNSWASCNFLISSGHYVSAISQTSPLSNNCTVRIKTPDWNWLILLTV